ncbi:MAG: carbohydrate ABC transporter permease, partial [Boseongicola sp. SB0673_bin_14]|nr:carbohydrate ABC transporter permease [Boseongicola sp. SB0673_bin_14]
MNKPSTRQTILVYLLLAIVLIVFLTPIYIIASSSVKPTPIMFQKPPAMIFSPTWDHY